MKRERIEKVELTPNLFKQILVTLSDEMVQLKESIKASNDEIGSKKENILKLNSEKSALAKTIRIEKRAFRKEKRVLRKIKKTLRIKSFLITEINDKFSSEKEKTINIKRYVK